MITRTSWFIALAAILLVPLGACSNAQDTGGQPSSTADTADGPTADDTADGPTADGGSGGGGDSGGGAGEDTSGQSDDGATGPTGADTAADDGQGQATDAVIVDPPQDTGGGDPPERALGPDIAVDPVLDTFSYISPLTVAMTRQINIGNMGDEPLHIESIEFGAGSSTDFSWVLKPTSPKTLAPDKWTMFQVKFACDVMGGPCNGADGTIEIVSDDPDTPVVTVVLKSQIKASVASPEPCGLLSPKSLNFGSVTRGDTKTLTATLSNCSEDEPLTVTKVTRSSFLFLPLSEEFQMDLESQTPMTIQPGLSQVISVSYTPQLAGPDAGYFLIQTNDPAEPNQQLDVSGIGVSPPEEELGLVIKLSWDTDYTDVDSHLYAPGGTFFDCDLDCHYGNPSPDWGVQGDWIDDPFLDVDDVDGYGPEHINISEPQPGTYRFVVHYYDDTYDFSSPTASEATVEVLSYGQVIASLGPEHLASSNWTWDVFEVTWPSLAVTQLGTTYQVSSSAIQACLPFFP